MANNVANTPFQEHGFEFAGPLGAFGISFGLPILVYIFAFACNDISGCPVPSLLSPKTLSLDRLKHEVGWPQTGMIGLFSWEALATSIGYVLVNAILYRVLPAAEVEGTVLRSGRKLKYRLNTFYCHTVILTALAAGTAVSGPEFPVWVFISNNYIQLITANILISYAVATFVYVRSFKPGKDGDRELAIGGQSGNMLYDWFIGRELNPRVTLPFIGEIDLKQWLELRPGMLGWLVMNCAWCAQQYRNFGYITDSIIFITVIQGLYILDLWWHEPAILTTIDITTDGFGMMLSFADFVWEPFVFSLQTRYLATYPLHLGSVHLSLMFAILGVGFYIFRSANNEKNRFRTDENHPQVKHLRFIKTETGSKLLISGWWGMARHINYLGDWLQSWPYCLPTGMAGYQILSTGAVTPGTDESVSYVMADGRQVVQGDAKGYAIPITYFYIIYFAILLVHRDGRDEAKCYRKYGKDWDRYKKIVRYRLIPGIY
ncbi:hypothetical protein FDECE_7997 [Fusarium decemcellulare]|nr:hypothetical protein FDECE_7997 [Fusarium decemcellulare]